MWEKCETTEALVSPVGSLPNRNYTVVSNQLQPPAKRTGRETEPTARTSRPEEGRGGHCAFRRRKVAKPPLATKVHAPATPLTYT